MWLTSISSFIIIWGFRWTRVRELNGSHVVTWTTEVQLARTILLSLAPWIPTLTWGRINPCHLTSEAVPPIITQFTSTERSFRTTAAEDKATTPSLCRIMIGRHCQPHARFAIYKCNKTYVVTRIKISVFWNMTPSGIVYRYQRFGDACYLHQGLPIDFTYDGCDLANFASCCCRPITRFCNRLHFYIPQQLGCPENRGSKLLRNIGTYSSLDVREPRYSGFPPFVMTQFNIIASNFVTDSDDSG